MVPIKSQKKGTCLKVERPNSVGDAEGACHGYFASFFSAQSFDYNYNRSRTSSSKGWPIALQTSLSLCHSGLLPNRVYFDFLSRSLFRRCHWFVFRFCALAGRCLCRVLQ